MKRKSFIPTVALVAGLALGAVAAPAFQSTTVSAQTQVTTQRSTLQTLFLDKLAGALGIQRPALDSAITSASKDTTADAVQQGLMTQAQADALNNRVQSGDLGALWSGRGGPGGRMLPAGVHEAMLDAAAKTLNITTDAFVTELRNGQTLAQVAQAHNSTEQAVTTAALAAAKAQLAQAVTAGTLTQAQADAIYSQLEQQGANLLTKRGGHGSRHGGRGAPTSPQSQTAPTTPQSQTAPTGI